MAETSTTAEGGGEDRSISEEAGRVTLLPSALWRALDAEAEIWATETDVAGWLAKLSSDPRSREKLNAVTRLCFEEGFYRGCLAAINRRSLADSINDAALVAPSPASGGGAAEPVAWPDLIVTLKNKIKEAEWHEYGRLQLSDFIVEQKERLVGALEGTARPSAYAYEANGPLGWQSAASPHKPSEAGHRNIRPLYAHPPVAAEPVAGWKLVPVEPTAEMKRSANKSVAVSTPDGTWALGVEEAARTYRAMIAAAPNPPAGGGETPSRIREWLEDALSPVGELARLSEGASPGTLSVSGSRRRYDEPSCVIVDSSSCAALFALATGERGKDTLQALADAKFLAGLWNAYRSGRLIEAPLAPAAPRKGLGEEEIAKIIRGIIGVRYDVACKAARAIIAIIRDAERETQGVEGCPVPDRYDRGECCGHWPCLAVPPSRKAPTPDRGVPATDAEAGR